MMKLKTERLHFEIHKAKNKPIGYIRNSYREDGQIKHQTISKIPNLTLRQLQDMKAAFDRKTFTDADIKLSHGREYGASAMLFELAKKIGLDKVIYSRNEEWVKCSLAMVIGRIIYQGSKLSLSKVSGFSCLWEICGVINNNSTASENAEETRSVIDVDEHCYEAMDELLARQKSIQQKLINKHLSEGSAILYDITSSYYEGEYNDSELVKFGYNRDKKKGKKQITIGLVCTKEGCPVAVEVFSGNTTHCTTVQDKMLEIKKKYGVPNFIFVGDRGMLTQKNINECEGKSESENTGNFDDITCITALTHSAMKTLCSHDNVQLSMFDENVIKEIILPEEPNVRYALKKNPVRREKEHKTRIALIEKTEAQLNKIAIPKKKTDDKTLISRASKVFTKYKTEKYFEWKVSDVKLKFSRKTDVIVDEELYDGLYVIRSNVPSEAMNICEVVDTYKSLINVEQAFRNMKTVQLEIRPMYHKTDERIKAHVFICMLSYYLLWHMNKALKPLRETKKDYYTQDYVIETMKALQKSKITIRNIESHKIAEPTQEQKQIQDLLINCEL